MGSLALRAREQAEGHLDGCLVCLNRLIEVQSDLQAIQAREDVTPGLVRRLEQLLGARPRPPLATRSFDSIRSALAFKIPVWSAAGVAAAILLAWIVGDRLHRVRISPPSPVAIIDPTDRLEPAASQVQHTVSGVVSSVRDATTNGVAAHVVDLRDQAGATYVFFTWGAPTIAPGDEVEIRGIITTAAQTERGRPSYQGVATAFRKVR